MQMAFTAAQKTKERFLEVLGGEEDDLVNKDMK